ncbi:hypothetical protein GGF46_003396 [Coemansia sp. RSA 552]|nr:hypothetical protein GGF46_003396 [Coemansia sp. RSA 552]
MSSSDSETEWWVDVHVKNFAAKLDYFSYYDEMGTSDIDRQLEQRGYRGVFEVQLFRPHSSDGLVNAVLCCRLKFPTTGTEQVVEAEPGVDLQKDGAFARIIYHGPLVHD